jgi:hypothetical protein
LLATDSKRNPSPSWFWNMVAHRCCKWFK